jgi:cell division protein FtsN
VTPDMKNSGKEEKPRGKGFLWFIAGIVVALILVFVFPAIHEAVNRVGNQTVNKAQSLQHKIAQAPASNAKGERKSEPTFDFYKLLSHPTQILTSNESGEVKSQPDSHTQVEKPGEYILQVASVKDPASAEKLKAQLALWGIVAHVQTVKVQGDSWHRIRIGPIKKLAKLNDIRAKLDRHNLKPLLIRANH